MTAAVKEAEPRVLPEGRPALGHTKDDESGAERGEADGLRPRAL